MSKSLHVFILNEREIQVFHPDGLTSVGTIESQWTGFCQECWTWAGRYHVKCMFSRTYNPRSSMFNLHVYVKFQKEYLGNQGFFSLQLLL